MNGAFSRIKIYLLFAALALGFCDVQGQGNYNAISFRIDSFANIGLPKSALTEVEKLDELARKNKNASQQIRATIYRMTFQSYLEEDALNAIIARLKTDIGGAVYPVKPVLQSLLAEMYWKYYEENRWKFNQRTRLLKPDTDITKWDLQTVINETSRLYELSLSDAAKEQQTPVGVLDGVLEGDSSTRYLRPTLYDLLVQRAFDFFLGDEASINKPRLPFSVNDPRFFSDSRTFAGLTVKTADTESIAYKAIKYLQQATLFHLEQPAEEALADLDMQRLKFVYDKSAADHKDSLYLAALSHLAKAFASKPINSEAIVLEGQFYQQKDSLVTAYNLFKKAVNAWPKSLGGKNAAILIKQLQEKELSATVENVNVTGKPILALLSYKNLGAAKLEIFRLNQSQLKEYLAIKGTNFLIWNEEKLRLLKKLNPLLSKNISWQIKDDFQEHSLEFKIDALPPGNYAMLLKDTTTSGDNLTQLGEFKVSELAYIIRMNPDYGIELRVMNRESGRPMHGVKLDLEGRTSNYNSTTKQNEWNNVEAKGVSDENGLFQSHKLPEAVSVNLILGKDTLTESSTNVNGAVDDSDDEPNDKTVFFTDRQIYRPGQTIYFKALQLQSLRGKNKIMADKKIAVEFLDANDKQVSLLRLVTNDFGAASGSLIIPQSTLDGNMTLKTDDGELVVKVEEYKRPSFQVSFLPVKESYKLNDTVMVRGTVNAFSGYGLSQAKVAYHVIRRQNWRYDISRQGLRHYQPNYYNIPEAEIKTDTITTDNLGRFQLKFAAASPNSAKFNNLNYTFQISADVTDESGETHPGESNVIIGNSDIQINTNLPEQLMANDSVRERLTLTNLNGQSQKGTVKVEIYSLKRPDGLFKKRLWESPDQYSMNRADFKKDFPGYAWADEDMIAKSPKNRKIMDSAIEADTSAFSIINLAVLGKQPAGAYLVKISAKNKIGDTTSITKYINIIAQNAKPVKFEDWVIPVVNYVKNGDTASFLIGTGKQGNVLMERYKGARLVSSKWISIDKGWEPIKLPINDTDKDVAVQFTMVYENRIYNSYQRIYITNTDKTLDMKFLTFHNKLQPGQKDEWKLQIGGPGNEMQAAEMVADLYDASLDDITPPEIWKNLLGEGDGYERKYFAWETYSFIAENNTTPLLYPRTSYRFQTRGYETLDMMGFNYYGGYNSAYQNYLKVIARKLDQAKEDKRLQENYMENASKVKTGYDITGKVVGADDKLEVPGASVRIKGTNIQTVTNISGNFKIKVPINGVLVVSYIGYETQEISTSKPDNIVISLLPAEGTLKEVTVVGYGAQAKKDVTGSITRITLRGLASDAKEIDSSSSEELLEGKVAGVVVESRVPAAIEKIVPRTNFNETAFFYPQLHTDENGQILIDFTIPEALTRWRFRALAHTKDLASGYIEREIVTQKELSISANTPRFLREGDTITVSARLANLTAGQLKGKVQLRLFNAVNMQPVNLLVNAGDAEQDFDVAGNTNKAVSFRLAIPAGLDALDYKLTADAGTFSDGEENTLPVLPNRMLVTESMPMMVRPGQTRDFTFDKLVNENSKTLKNKTLTLEYTANPAWYAVQALPYMMEFPYECSEQIFSRYFANSLATNIVTKMPAIKKVFDQWRAANSTELLSNLEKNQELKSTLIEETPWLRDAENETEQKKRIALLFDLNQMSNELQLNLDKLQKRQLSGGGFTWFGGEYPDLYITQHIAEGMGELLHLGIGKDNAELGQIAGNAISYLDDQLVADEKARKKEKQADLFYGDLEIHAWFTRSYFSDKPLSQPLQAARDGYLKWAEGAWKFRNAYEQGMIALTMQRYGKPDVTAQIERSLLETAQQSDDLGMYWAKNQLGYFWYESPVETQSLLIDLFTEAGDNAKAVEEMKIWLLRNKQTNDWKTTKATAAACYALLLKGSNLLADSGSSKIKLRGKALEELKPDVKADAGTGYLKTSWLDEQVKPSLGKVEITNHGSTIGWGALHWQYLENLDKITSAQTNIHLERKYFIQKQTDAGPVLTALDTTHQPKIGDLLKVVVFLTADRDFEYVQLKDMRPAGTEPVDALSAYKYQDGLYYYQVTKDVATNFFISELNKGSYVFEYSLRVAQPGNFSTGITSVQCMYAPEFNAHSLGGRLEVR